MAKKKASGKQKAAGVVPGQSGKAKGAGPAKKKSPGPAKASPKSTAPSPSFAFGASAATPETLPSKPPAEWTKLMQDKHLKKNRKFPNFATDVLVFSPRKVPRPSATTR